MPSTEKRTAEEGYSVDEIKAHHARGGEFAAVGSHHRGTGYKDLYQNGSILRKAPCR